MNRHIKLHRQRENLSSVASSGPLSFSVWLGCEIHGMSGFKSTLQIPSLRGLRQHSLYINNNNPQLAYTLVLPTQKVNC